jgi:hypothetical protein
MADLDPKDHESIILSSEECGALKPKGYPSWNGHADVSLLERDPLGQPLCPCSATDATMDSPSSLAVVKTSRR